MRGEYLSVAKNDFIASDVSVVKVIEWSQGRRGGNERDEVTDRNNFVGVLMIVVTLLDIGRK